MPPRHRRSNKPGFGEPWAYPLTVKRLKQSKATGVHLAAERLREAEARVHETADDRGAPSGLGRWRAALLDLEKAMSQL